MSAVEPTTWDDFERGIRPCSSLRSPWVIELEVKYIDLRVVAIMSGIPLVDLSIEYEPHLVRGYD